MERRDFSGKSGCGLAGIITVPTIVTAKEEQSQRKRYKIDIEIYEAREKTHGVIIKETNLNIRKIGENFVPG